MVSFCGIDIDISVAAIGGFASRRACTGCAQRWLEVAGRTLKVPEAGAVVAATHFKAKKWYAATVPGAVTDHAGK